MEMTPLSYIWRKKGSKYNTKEKTLKQIFVSQFVLVFLAGKIFYIYIVSPPILKEPIYTLHVQ